MKRESSIELLRILLMITIPVYHLMMYNGVFYIDNVNSYIALGLSVGGAIPADYAFMAMSSFFLLKKENSNIRRFVLLLLQVLTLFLVKYITLRALFGYNNNEYFVDFFLMRGAWWYIYPYLILLIIYPMLNDMIARISRKVLYIITLILGIILCVQGIINKPSFIQDCIAFLFTYFIFACFKDIGLFDKKIKKSSLIIIIIACEIIMLVVSFGVKLGWYDVLSGYGDDVIKYVIGRYHPISICMGYCIFFLFKEINIGYCKWINKIARVTFYVFLLHDTIMGIFWYFGKCDKDYGYYSTGEFVLWMLIYVVTCFVLCGLLQLIYENTLSRLFEKLVDKMGK